MIYSINPIFQTNIGSRRTRIVGELIVPDAPQNPANARSLLPLTRPHDPNRMNKPSLDQQKRTKESFPTVSSAPKSSNNSSDAKTSTNAAVSAAASPSTRSHEPKRINKPSLDQQKHPEKSYTTSRPAPKVQLNSSSTTESANTADPAAPQAIGQTTEIVTPPNATRTTTEQQKPTDQSIQMSRHVRESSKRLTNARTSANGAASAGTQTAGYSSELVTPPYAMHADETFTRSTTPPTIATDSERARAFWAKRANAKTPAAASAGPQAAEPPSITKSRAVSTMETNQRCTTSPTTVLIDHDIKSRANLFKGTRKPVAKDGACLFGACLFATTRAGD
jgi:hypothetical protein